MYHSSGARVVQGKRFARLSVSRHSPEAHGLSESEFFFGSALPSASPLNRSLAFFSFLLRLNFPMQVSQTG
jgi:hypothetical protein